MPSSDARHRLVLVATALLVILGPVLIIFATLSMLSLFGDLVFSRVSFVEFLELYIVDLILFGGFAFLLYQLMLYLMEDQLPTALTELDAEEADDAPDSSSESTEDR